MMNKKLKAAESHYDREVAKLESLDNSEDPAADLLAFRTVTKHMAELGAVAANTCSLIFKG